MDMQRAKCITWHEPPPSVTTFDNDKLLPPARQRLLRGHKATLNWNFTLSPNLTLSSILIFFNEERAASIVPSQDLAGVTDKFKGQFSINWKSQKASLTILNVTNAEDKGELRCVLCTREGVTKKTWNRTIKVDVVAPALITATSDDQNLAEGSTLTLSCNSTGKPTPNITWTKVSNGGSDSQLMFDSHGNPMTLVSITRNASGTYQCTADNGIGTPVNRTILVTVNYGPLANSQKRRTVSEGEPVNIPCLKDSGNPSAVITWYKGNDTHGNKTTNSSTLKFQNAASSDEGWYTCFAENEVGNVSATFFLSVVPRTEPSTASILCVKAPSVIQEMGATEMGATLGLALGLSFSLTFFVVLLCVLVYKSRRGQGAIIGVSLQQRGEVNVAMSGPQPSEISLSEQMPGAAGGEAISSYATTSTVSNTASGSKDKSSAGNTSDCAEAILDTRF